MQEMESPSSSGTEVFYQMCFSQWSRMPTCPCLPAPLREKHIWERVQNLKSLIRLMTRSL